MSTVVGPLVKKLIIEENLQKTNQQESHTEKSIYKKIKSIWPYLASSNVCVRQCLNTSLKITYSCGIRTTSLEGKITSLIKGLKFLILPGIIFKVELIYNAFTKLIKNFNLRDHEGLALASLSAVLISGDFLSSLMDMVNTTLATLSKPQIISFITIGIPLSYFLLTLDSLLKAIQVFKTASVMHKFKNIAYNPLINVPLEDIRISLLNLKKFIEKEITLSQKKQAKIDKDWLENALERKKQAFLRNVNEEVLKIFNEVHQDLKKIEANNDFTKESLKEIVGKLEYVIPHLKKKACVDTIAICANLISVVGLALSSVVPFAWIPASFMSAGITIKLLNLCYKDGYLGGPIGGFGAPEQKQIA